MIWLLLIPLLIVTTLALLFITGVLMYLVAMGAYVLFWLFIAVPTVVYKQFYPE